MTSIKQQNLPRHVAIIMDGNGRWAKKHAFEVARGHIEGVEALKRIVRYSSDIGIEALSVYAFSTENWNRSAAEVRALMQLILRFFASEVDELHANGVRMRIIGDKDGLPDAQRETVTNAENLTKDNQGLQFNIALNYGSQDEILRAVRKLAEKVAAGEMSPDAISQPIFESFLDTAGLPGVDLVIRTSGEMRLSNFLLYQVAYAEFVFPEVLWPDFSLDQYQAILSEFGTRDRRFGGRKL